jgi:NAD(P)-dependent dehydrogenase (short-subunit alcohol dehydrogenase family)
MSLKGKTLFITGASRGIGLAIGVRAARDGANIAIAAKSDQPHPKLPGTIHTAAREIEEAGGKALPMQVDIRDENAVAAAAKQCAEHFGGIDIVVNNASAISLSGTLDVRDQREVADLALDLLERLRRLQRRHRHAHEVGARLGAGLDLRDRGGHVLGVRVRHGLHGDGRAAADWHAADADLPGLAALDRVLGFHGSLDAATARAP